MTAEKDPRIEVGSCLDLGHIGPGYCGHRDHIMKAPPMSGSSTPKLDQRIASAEGDAQAKGRLLDKAERGKRALQADNRRLRGLLAMVTQERDDFAKQLGIEPEWTEADV